MEAGVGPTSVGVGRLSGGGRRQEVGWPFLRAIGGEEEGEAFEEEGASVAEEDRGRRGMERDERSIRVDDRKPIAMERKLFRPISPDEIFFFKLFFDEKFLSR